MAKKITLKDVEERINVLAYNINHIKMAVDNVSFALSKYIDMNGKTGEFKKYLENMNKNGKLNENEQK
jgi:hypothetical protein